MAAHTNRLQNLSVDVNHADKKYIICLVRTHVHSPKSDPKPGPQSEQKIRHSDNHTPCQDFVEIRDIVPHLIPEALVVEYVAFKRGPSDVSVKDQLSTDLGKPVASELQDDYGSTAYISPDSVQTEALDLVNQLRDSFCRSWQSQHKKDERDDPQPWKKILLVGHRFGSLIIKQAVILANTNPSYYRLALQISHIVFMGPRPGTTDLAAWDNLFISIIQNSGLKVHGRMAETLSGLSDTAMAVSRRFHRFLSRYAIAYMEDAQVFDGVPNTTIETKGVTTGVRKQSEFKNDDEPSDDCLRFSRNSIDVLQGIRGFFAPLELLYHANSEDGESEELYLRFLEMLSTSRFSIYEIDVDSEFKDMFDLEDFYLNELRRLNIGASSSKSSIQIIGPPRHGKSSLLKIIHRKIREKVPAIILEYWFDPSSDMDPQAQIYDILATFIRQIISQKPSSFAMISRLVEEYFAGETWTERNLRVIFDLLRDNLGLSILLIIPNFGKLAKEVQSWLRDLTVFLDQCSDGYCYLISNDKHVVGLTSGEPIILDLGPSVDRFNRDLLPEKIAALVNNTTIFRPLKGGERERIGRKLEENIHSMGDLLLSAGLYTRYLMSRTPQLSNCNFIEFEIETSPKTRQSLFEYQVQELKGRSPDLFRWGTLLLSWVLNSFRPLSASELAAALAIEADDDNFVKLDGRICRDLTSDIGRYLSLFVRADCKVISLWGSKAEFTALLSDLRHGQPIQVADHGELSRNCLHYLKIVLLQTRNDQGLWKRCQSQAARTWAHPVEDGEHPALEFLDYAVRYWPEHYHHAVRGKPSDHLDYRVLDFLNDPDVNTKWFSLYLAANGVLQQNSDEAFRTVLNAAQSSTSNSNDEATGLYLAKYLGFSSAAAKMVADNKEASNSLLGSSNVVITRGKWIRKPIFPDETDKSFLRAAIHNKDNTGISERLMGSDTAAHIFTAAQGGRVDILELLPNDSVTRALDEHRRNAIHFAVLGGNINAVSHFQRLGVSIDGKDSHGETPLMLATKVGNFEAAKYIIKCGANMTTTDSCERAALHYAIEWLQLRTTSRGNIGILDIFLGAKYNLDLRSSVLRVASRSGDSLIFQRLLDAWVDQVEDVINMQDNEGRTLLHIAVANGRKVIVEILLKLKADANILDKHGFLPQALAAKNGHLEILKLLPECPEDNAQLLYRSSEAGQLLVVQYLVSERGFSANPHGEDKANSPLMIAAISGHAEIVKFLLARGGDPDVEGRERRTPLHEAVEKGYTSVVRNLIEAGADVNSRDAQRRTPLHFAAGAGASRMVELLLDMGEAKVDVLTRGQSTALHLGVKNSEVVQLLLKHGAEKKLKNSSGRTPLILASISGYTISARVLLNGDAAACEVDENGHTALYHAIRNNNSEIAMMLSKSGKCVQKTLSKSIRHSDKDTFQAVLNLFPHPIEIFKLTNYKGDTLLHKAIDQDSGEFFKILVDMTQLSPPPRPGCAVDTLQGPTEIDNKRLLDLQNERGETPLYRTASQGLESFAKVLLSEGANPRICGNGGWSPLHVTVDKPEFLRIFISSGADINCRSNQGITPLMLAVNWCEREAVEILLENNADVELETKSGVTALHHAAKQSDGEILKLLLQKGANVNKEGDGNMTPLSLALESAKPDNVRLLLEYGANLEDLASGGRNPLSIATTSSEVLDIILTAGKEKTPKLWNRQQVEDATISGCERRAVGCISLLVKEEPWLLTTRILEQYIAKLKPHDKNPELQEELAIGLINAGLDPFGRSGERNESPFDLLVYSLREIRSQVLDFCISKIGEDLSMFGDGFRVLRNSIEMKSETLWEKLQPLRERASQSFDKDNWSLDHHLYQARETFSGFTGVIPDTTPEGPTSLMIPKIWKDWNLNPDIDSGLDLKSGGLEVLFKNMDSHNPDGSMIWDGITIRSDRPFPPNGMGARYFEIDIEPDDAIKDVLGQGLTVCIGLCGEFSFLANSRCGWNLWSIGYHGDDGNIMFGNDSQEFEKVGHIYGFGDTVGCGINYHRKEVFFTLNGCIIANIKSDIIFRKIYPIISHIGRSCEIRANFGTRSFSWPKADVH